METTPETLPIIEPVVQPTMNEINILKPSPDRGNERVVIVVLFLIVFVVVAGVSAMALLSLKNAKRTSSNPPIAQQSTDTDNPPTVVVGVFRSAAFDTMQQEQLGLPNVQYQITDFAQNPADSIQGYFLSSDQSNYDPEALMGKCVEVVGIVPSEWQSKDFSETFMRSYLIPAEIKIVDFSKCSPYRQGSNEVTEGVLEKVTLTGVLVYGIRPASEIGYDYNLELSEPYLDTTSASGLPTELNRVVVSPQNNSLWAEFENNINQEIIVEAEVMWGFSESKYFEVSKIVSSKSAQTTETGAEDPDYYKDDYYKIGIGLPFGWSRTNQIIEEVPTITLSKDNSECNAPKIYIGSDAVLSTSGALCANESCENSSAINLNVAGEDFSNVPVMHAGAGVDSCGRYIFRVTATSIITSPAVTIVYQSEADKAEILEILKGIINY